MRKMSDLTGKRFGRLIVVERDGSSKHKRAAWKCRCDCGKIKTVSADCLMGGNTKSCGCLNTEVRSMRMTELHTKHGESRTRLYAIWGSMINRCNDENAPYYKNYGGRGITVCKEWRTYSPFRDWALANGYKDNLSIDRIDVNGNYEPSNCRWATRKEQANNTRANVYLEYNGKRQTVEQWAEELGVLACTIGWRIKNGWSVAEALSVKPNEFRKTRPKVLHLDCKENWERISRELSVLNQRERDVICFRYRDKMTQEEIGETLGLTRARIGQIERGAMKKIMANSDAID